MGMRCDCERCSTLARTVGSVANLFENGNLIEARNLINMEIEKDIM
jgi:hypothetical protein